MSFAGIIIIVTAHPAPQLPGFRGTDLGVISAVFVRDETSFATGG